MLFIGARGGGLFLMCAILGCAASVCLLPAVLCGSPATGCPYPMSTAGGLFFYGFCGEEKNQRIRGDAG